MGAMIFWCDDCQAFTLWFSPEESSELVCKSLRTLYIWIEDAKVHAQRLPGLQWIMCWCSICGERGRNAANNCETRLAACRRKLQEVAALGSPVN